MKNNNQRPRDTVSLVYQGRLPLSARTVNYVAELLRKHSGALEA